MSYVKTETPGVWVRHAKSCASHNGRRCTCTPAWRGRRRNPATGKSEWSRRRQTRNEVLVWIGSGAPEPAREAAKARKTAVTFGELADEWLAGVAAGTIERRGGRPYSPTTQRTMRIVVNGRLRPEFGDRIAEELDEREWQVFIDDLATRHARSTVNQAVATARAIYRWAARPSRRKVSRNPLRNIEIIGRPAQPRTLVLSLAEIEAMLAALPAADALPYAVAFGAGLRRAEIDRLDWSDVDLKSGLLHVREAKSEAGKNRWVPMAGFLRSRLEWEWRRRGRPSEGRVVTVSVMSHRLAERATIAWAQAGVTRVTLHTGRHTYASHLMAAGYTLSQHQQIMGHADLQMTARYAKVVPPRDGERIVELLENYAGVAVDLAG